MTVAEDVPGTGPIRSTTFGELLAIDTVEETSVLRSTRLGFMAYHGGELEKVTDVVAAEAAERSGASYYGVTQAVDPLHHIASTRIDPADSPRLTTFLGHVDAVITIHGYGLKTKWKALLLGGQNRELAAHVAGYLRPALPEYEMEDDLEEIPKRLAGQHPKNPVNLPRHQGLQIELPPTIRWNVEGRHWSDFGEGGRAPDTETLISALATAATAWIGRAA